VIVAGASGDLQMPLPELAQTITSYRVLDKVVQEDFLTHRRNILLIAAKGLGKTWRIKKAIAQVPNLYVVGHAAPTKHFAAALAATDHHIVYDDYTDAIKSDEIGEMLKQQTECVPTRTVRWDGAATAVPKVSFDTTSPILLVLNAWRSGPTWEALADRCSVFEFAPSAIEWVEQVRGWLATERVAGTEVMDYLDQRLPDLVRMTCRAVKAALDVARDGGAMPWRSYIDALCEGGNPAELAMREIVRSLEYKHATDGAIVAAWRNRTGKGKSWGHDLLDRVRRMFEIESGTAPIGEPVAAQGAPHLPPGAQDDRTDAPAAATPAAASLPQNPPDERTPPPAAIPVSPPDERTSGQTAPLDTPRPVVRSPEGEAPQGSQQPPVAG
jgi:hypothetical protein